MEPTTVSRRPAWPGALRALRHREFRLLWIGLVVSATGTWMQIVALSLLVLKLTHGSAFALGCVSLAQAIAFFLFALIGGGLADRVNRRRLLLGTQTGLMLVAGTLGLLTVTGAITVPMIAFCAFLSGVLLSFDQPARAALISTLVPKEDLLNAISLQSAVFNGAAVAGPALAGMTVHFAGLPANFFINALSYLAVLGALLLVRSGAAAGAGRERLAQQVTSVLKTVRRDQVLFPLLCVYGVLLFAGPSLALLVPVLAATRLHVGPGMLGLLFSAAGLGAVGGTIALGSLQAASLWVMRSGVAGWCLALAIAGISRTVPLTFCALLVLGAAQSIVGASTSTFLQTRMPQEQRGRVMSLNTLLVMGVRPLGDFPAGAAIGLVGGAAAAVGSAAVVGITATIAFWRGRGKH